MYRRLQLRRQLTMLLVSMRIGYGGTILVLLLIRVNTPNSLMWQIVQNGGMMLVTLCVLAAAALLLLLDGIFAFIWPLIASTEAEEACKRSHWFPLGWLQRLRKVLRIGCGLANNWRHWFYLPPAFACLFSVPVAAYIGAEGLPLLSILYLWLFLCGCGAAVMEGIINNERHRYNVEQ